MGSDFHIPREVAVKVSGSGEPCRLLLGRRWQTVARVAERWRVDEEWWRQEICRLYYRLELANGTVETVFHDLRSDKWYLQRY